MYAFAFYVVIVLSFVIKVQDIPTWKQTLLLRSAIAFCLDCFLAALSIFLDKCSNTAYCLLCILLVALCLVFILAFFLRPRWVWQSILIFAIPFIAGFVICSSSDCFIMS